MYRKFLLFTSALLTSTAIFSQDNYIHIPKNASYVITMRPYQQGERNNAESLSRLEMFGNSRDYNDDLYVYGSQSLASDPRERLTNYLGSILSDPKTTGIDSLRNIYAFHEESDTCSYWAYILPVSNEAVFSEYLTAHLFINGAEVTKDRGYSSINYDRITAGWTNNYAIIVLTDYYRSTYTEYAYPAYEEPSEEEMERLIDSIHMADSIMAVEARLAAEQEVAIISDSAKNAQRDALAEENQQLLQRLEEGELPEDTLLGMPAYMDYPYYEQEAEMSETAHDEQALRLLNRLINLEYDNSLASNKNFASLQAEKFDAAYWYNYGLVMQEEYRKKMDNRNRYGGWYGDEQQQDTLTFPSMWQESYVSGLVTFNDTITDIEHRITVGNEMSNLTTGMYRGRVDRRMLNYVRGDNLLSLVCLSVDMEKFIRFSGHVYRENIRYSGMGMFEQTYLAMWEIMRVFIDDETMYELFTGKFVFAVTDLKPVVTTFVTYEYDDDFNRREVTEERTEIVPEFVFMAGVGRKKDMQKILDILERTELIKKVNEDYYMVMNTANPASQMYIVFRKGILMFTNNEDLVNNHLDKGYKGKQRLGKKMRKTARKSPLVAWWDGKRTFDTVRKIEKDDPDGEEKTDLERYVSSGLIMGKKGRKGEHRIQMTITMPAENEGDRRSPLDRFFRVLNGLFLIVK